MHNVPEPTAALLGVIGLMLLLSTRKRKERVGRVRSLDGRMGVSGARS